MRRVGRIALLGVAVTATAVELLIWRLPLPDELLRPVAGTLTLLDDHGREIAELASPEARVQIPVPLSEMGEWLPRITVALEDQRFYEHTGIDWRATAAACLRNFRSGRVVSGGSTITQQLVKLARNRRRRSWLGKLYETVLAWKLEREWSKDRILAEYLNCCSFGNRRLGPEAAARAYFGKPARNLTLAEAIFLAGIPQAPTRLNPWHYPDLTQRKFAHSVFLRGTEPTEDSASWFSAEGKLRLPGEYAASCSGGDNTIGAAVVPEPRIMNPLPDSRYEIDSELPRTQPMIELTTTIGNDVQWYVNGVPVLPQRDGRFFWQLAPGGWELRAIGRNAAVQEKITVE